MEDLEAYVLPDRKWGKAQMARVMPKERDATTKPTFIPLKTHARGYIEGLTKEGIKEARIDFPSGVVLIADPLKMVDEDGKPKSAAILPLCWIEPDQMSLELDQRKVVEGIVILFRPHSESHGENI